MINAAQAFRAQEERLSLPKLVRRVSVIVTLMVAPIAAAVSLPPASFFPSQYPTVGLEPYSSATGDFNGDGIPDVAVTNYASNSVSLLFGKGDGTFGAASQIPLSAPPTGIAAGDLRGDGILDLIVSGHGTDNVFVFLGNGDGTFKPPAIYTSGNSPRDPVTADLNGDGILDFATPNVEGDSVSVFLGNGDGTFKPAQTFPVLAVAPKTVVAGDLNGDGKIDLATGNDNSGNCLLYTSYFPIFLSNGC